ncbi:MAG TPA: hypothetical protein VN345_00740 [Blastocatellia bacterium]|jgi:hypothetical protein|nr:hypothetical protein [Blastocatellia bacterium]
MSKLGLAALILLFFGVSAVVMPRRADQSTWITQTPSKKRKVIDITNRSIPAAITAVNNLDKDTWLDDVEFEIENRSNRPIYHLMIMITFPDVPKRTDLDGVPRGLAVTAQYGRRDFAGHPGELAKPEDVPIKVGEKVLLRIPTELLSGLKDDLTKRNVPESATMRLRVRIEQLSFVDGSGYRAGSVPFYPRSEMSSVAGEVEDA